MQTNRLANETSPYLLQHQHNPVDWFPWGEEALKKAKKEDKPIIVSIGYSACHWCHVMEKEAFEDEAVADIMNREFVCIKVDREERPDVDQIYMDAIQAMGLQGGWPLNAFLTPDQKPFYGGTYFPKQTWIQLLKNVANAFKQSRQELEDSAEKFAEALSTSDFIKFDLEVDKTPFTRDNLNQIYSKFATRFDTKRGGLNNAPKFPMPSHWLFLLRYWHVTQNEEALKQVELTLTEMAWGGIYDQLGGGFARYSVDAEWFVPHFEKMLYDNGQLLSLYSEAYTATKKPLFKEVVYQTIDWLEREMRNEEGSFYSALDADSEGEEGKFYCWQLLELEEILGSEADIFCDFYNVDEQGNWEHGKNILFRRESVESFAQKYELNAAELTELLSDAREKLLNHRNKRVHPGLDDKILTAWNGLALTGLADAYAAFGEQRFMDLAVQNAEFVETRLRNDNKLYRTYKGRKASLDGYLEDYACVIQGYIRLYEICFDEKWLYKAKELTKYVLDNFWDDQEKLFYFTDATAEKLIARKKELFDNVIPSSNSLMAINLYRLGLLLDIKKYQETAKEMLAVVNKLLINQPQYLTNWASLYCYQAQPTAEIAIVGKDLQEASKKLHQYYLPNSVLAGTKSKSDLPLLENREAEDEKTTFYLCYNMTCQRPVFSVTDLIDQLDINR